MIFSLKHLAIKRLGVSKGRKKKLAETGCLKDGEMNDVNVETEGRKQGRKGREER